LKADMNLVGALEGMSALHGAVDVVRETSDLDHEIDVVAWNVPVPDGEQCKNPVCHRIFSIFGPPYTHRQLNHWTHTALREMFGTVAIKPFEQLVLIMQKGRVVDSAGNDTYLQPAKAKNLALPISSTCCCAAMPATCGAVSRSCDCRPSCTTASSCTLRCCAFAACAIAGRASTMGTIPSSGAACPKRRCASSDV
jgi:hypothetical protein